MIFAIAAVLFVLWFAYVMLTDGGWIGAGIVAVVVFALVTRALG